MFPTPRLQTNDDADMAKFLSQEKEILYPAQPFEDSAGAIHISINQAMALIAERGLPVRPSAPTADSSTQAKATNTAETQKEGVTQARPAKNQPAAPAQQ